MSNSDDSYGTQPAFRIFSRNPIASRWSAFFESKPPIHYPKRAVIVAQGEENPHIFFILRGLVEYTSTSENGTENILEILGPGNMLNLQPVFGKNPSIATFAALSECTLASADKNEIYALMEHDKSLTDEILQEMAFIIGGLNRQISLGIERTDSRLLRVIHMIATLHCRVYLEPEPINIRLSQDDLARITRTTRVTISKILSELRGKGILEINYGGISIKNMELLTQLAKTLK